MQIEELEVKGYSNQGIVIVDNEDRYVVKMHVETGAPYNPEFAKSNGYTCTLKYNDKQYSIPYYQGYGIKTDPTIQGVLECLFSDASVYDNSKDLADFANTFGLDMGFPEGHKRAKRLYNDCKRVKENLDRLFGSDYDTIDDAICQA